MARVAPEKPNILVGLPLIYYQGVQGRNMIKAPSTEDAEKNQARQKKIHQILREDAINRLKNNEVLVPANKKLLKLLIQQEEFVGNIDTWMPSMDAKSKLAKMGLVEDGFIIGGFREWFADEVKQLILRGEISNVIKLFNHMDPSILGDLAGIKDKKYAFVRLHANWLIKFNDSLITLKHNTRLYYLIKLLENPGNGIYFLDLKRFANNQKRDAARKVRKVIIEEEIKQSLNQRDFEELKNLQIRQIMEDFKTIGGTAKSKGITRVGDKYYPAEEDVQPHKSPFNDKEEEKKEVNKVAKQIQNVRNDIERCDRALYSHLKICITVSNYCVYQPELDPSIKQFENWYIRY